MADSGTTKRRAFIIIPLVLIAIVVILFAIGRARHEGTNNSNNVRATNSREGLPAPEPPADSSLTRNRPELLANFPEDIFLIDGTVTAYEEPSGDRGYVVTIQSLADRQTAQSQYEQNLSADGWSVSVEAGVQNNTIVRGEKDSRTVRVDISDSEPGVFVVIEASASS
ncbi:MAG: hypothetical protein PHY34_05190 [Patescibacteria group bacterium]|nr:hypothetical protein [Patescibacteria group bacterium]MDD5715754.1 hypothetical protein [Patescibacteria group bacterium]